MTLDTRMYLQDEVDVHAFFHHFRELLGATDAHPYRDEDSEVYGHWVIGNQLGIGLPALVSVHYSPGAALRLDGDACSDYCSEYRDDDGKPIAYHLHWPAHWAYVSMDTAYGYRDEHGRGCGDLHASYVAQLGQWLDERGVRWSWENEYDGSIHGGEDRYERLTDLMQSGHRATRWFESWVLPAIASGRVP